MEPLDSPALVLWCAPAGHRPSPQEARQALLRLEQQGPTAAAFTFAKPYVVSDGLALVN
jgi:hypothetical protein